NFGDDGHAENEHVREQYELDGFGSAGGKPDGSGPAAGVHFGEPTTGGNAARAGASQSGADRSGSGESGAADYDGSSGRPRDHARKRIDQVFVAAHSRGGDLSAKPDARSATGADSAG